MKYALFAYVVVRYLYLKNFILLMLDITNSVLSRAWCLFITAFFTFSYDRK